MASHRPAPRYPSFASFSVSTKHLSPQRKCSNLKRIMERRWRNILARKQFLASPKVAPHAESCFCKLTAFPVSAYQGVGRYWGVANKAGQAPRVYRSPFPLLDSPYRISSASITNYMHTCLLRATAPIPHAALSFWNRESVSLIPQSGNL